MFAGQRVLALIPARGGSKALPGKNVAPLLGRPLIAWTIAAARSSRFVDDVIVTTDDEDVARVARSEGALVPFRRPAQLATDEAGMSDVIAHALDELTRESREYHWLLLLQPTAPLRTAEHIDAAFERLAESGGAAVVSVCEAEHSLSWMGQLPADGNMASFVDDVASRANRQQLATYYRLNGAVYLSAVDYWRAHRGFLGPRTFAYTMRQDESVDIDTSLDLEIAAHLMARRRATD